MTESRRLTMKIVIAAAIVALALPASVLAEPRQSGNGWDNPQALGEQVTTTGTTNGGARKQHEPAVWCARSKDVVWYRVDVARKGPVVARVAAQGDLRAGVAVF